MTSSQTRDESKRCRLCRQKNIRQSLRSEKSVRTSETNTEEDSAPTEPCNDCSDACSECRAICIECHRFKWVKCAVKGCHVHFPPEESMIKIRIMTPQPKKPSPLSKFASFCCSSDSK